MRAGKRIAVALADGVRSPVLPGSPTIAEQGYKDVKLGAWHGIFAPKGTPAAIVQTLNAHMNEILKMPDVIARMASFGARPVGGRPEALARINANEYAQLTRLIKDLNIQAD